MLVQGLAVQKHRYSWLPFIYITNHFILVPFILPFVLKVYHLNLHQILIIIDLRFGQPFFKIIYIFVQFR